MRTFFLLIVAAVALVGAAPAPVTFTDYAAQFDAIETRTRGEDPDRRIADVQAAFDELVPGLYSDEDASRLKTRIGKALADFPAIRESYRRLEARFPVEFAGAVVRFRRFFPQFVSPMPIFLVHDLGIRDGGSDIVGGRKVMLFGADLIVRLHDDDSLQPFLDHELFHLEHARHFADCDQLWCPLWQEGLATYAASVMTPHASDHQLMLDVPAPIRGPTDGRWRDALCYVSARFDATGSGDIDDAFLGDRSPQLLPARFGYYVGLRVAQLAGGSRTLGTLARLNDTEARRVVAKALGTLIAEADAPCAAPSNDALVTHKAPRTP